MPDLQPTTASARSVALQFAPDTQLLAGDFLRIITSPQASATARTVEGTDPTAALATARGLGAGYSRYYAGLADAAFFNSLDFSLHSGGGLLDGTASASALASGRGDTEATALATNVGLANLSYLDRYGGSLLLGSSDSPLAAIARAATGSVLAPSPGSLPSASLQADATVRGLEAEADPSLTPGGSRSIYGQPTAVVRATSELLLDHPGARLTARGSADATGLENSTIHVVPAGNGDGSASLLGDAAAELRLLSGPSRFASGASTESAEGAAASDQPALSDAAATRLEGLSLNGRASGLEGSILYGAPTLATTISGRGLATLEAASIRDAVAAGAITTDPAAAASRQGSPAPLAVERLEGIGISNSRVFTNQGNDLIRGFGGISGAGLLQSPAGTTAPSADAGSSGGGLLQAGRLDAAGIDRSGLYTGLGDDLIVGRILNELDSGIDADGDGELEASQFLDRSAVDADVGGFDGIRHSTANTGIGNDLIAGAANGSHFYTEIGNDSIDLDRAKASSLWGGIGSDLLRINGPAQSNVLWGGFGDDAISVQEGDGNVLDGGYGQDVSTGGSGVDRFLFSEAGAALTAASGSGFGGDLTELPFWASLSEDQKDEFWQSGRLLSSDGAQLLGAIDTVREFQAGAGGDVMELSSSLASITQELWESKGALFGVGSDGRLSVQEASADGSNRLGVVVGSLEDIHKLGIGSPSIAYATDTRQLMFDADGNWNNGAISLGTVNVNGALSKGNFAFGATTGNGSGAAPTAQGAV